MNDSGDLVTCYYCWYSDRLSRFRILARDKYSERCKCPECNISLNYIILTKFTVEQKAKWLYLNIRRYRGKHFNFFDNIQFDKIKRRLQGYEIEEFWDSWKYVKENYDKIGDNELKKLYAVLASKDIEQKSLLSYTVVKRDGE